jgi:hypothetical protein
MNKTGLSEWGSALLTFLRCQGQPFSLAGRIAISPITEPESMEKFRPNVFWLKGRKSRHQFQINRKD